MNTDDFYYLGYIAKTFGFEGQVVLALEVDSPTDYKELESVFILMEGKLVPFFVHKITIRAKGKEAVVDFIDVDTIEKARRICGARVYLPLKKLPDLEDNAFYYHELEGFRVFMTNGVFLGTVIEILEYPGNPLFSIKGEKGEILIPLHDDFIQDLDKENKKIWLDPPEGLMDLFTEG